MPASFFFLPFKTGTQETVRNPERKSIHPLPYPPWPFPAWVEYPGTVMLSIGGPSRGEGLGIASTDPTSSQASPRARGSRTASRRVVNPVLPRLRTAQPIPTLRIPERSPASLKPERQYHHRASALPARIRIASALYPGVLPLPFPGYKMNAILVHTPPEYFFAFLFTFGRRFAPNTTVAD